MYFSSTKHKQTVEMKMVNKFQVNKSCSVLQESQCNHTKQFLSYWKIVTILLLLHFHKWILSIKYIYEKTFQSWIAIKTTYRTVFGKYTHTLYIITMYISVCYTCVLHVHLLIYVHISVFCIFSMPARLLYFCK